MDKSSKPDTTGRNNFTTLNDFLFGSSPNCETTLSFNPKGDLERILMKSDRDHTLRFAELNGEIVTLYCEDVHGKRKGSEKILYESASYCENANIICRELGPLIKRFHGSVNAHVKISKDNSGTIAVILTNSDKSALVTVGANHEAELSAYGLGFSHLSDLAIDGPILYQAALSLITPKKETEKPTDYRFAM